MKFAMFEQIKKSLESVKRYALGEIGNVANATVEAVEEIAGELNNKFDKTGGTIDGNITVNGSVSEGYVTVANPNVLKIKKAIPSSNTITFDTTFYNHSANFNKLKVNMMLSLSGDVNKNIYTIKSIDTTNHSIVVNERLLYSSIMHFIVLDIDAYRRMEHAEGSHTVAAGSCSHAEGAQTIAEGMDSHAEGGQTIAIGMDSHAEGSNTTATGLSSHAEGSITTASGDCSHAEGEKTQANNYCSHAEGYFTQAKDRFSHAEGRATQANGNCSHAGGYGTVANYYQTTIGKFNIDTTGGEQAGTTGSAFIVGNGTDDSVRSNCFRVQYDGGVYAKAAYHSSGADYAEYFQWKDDNINNEDRVGLFVTLDGEKISIAKPNDDILGIVSACPSVCGDAQEDQWRGMYPTDVYGRPILEEVTIPDEFMVLPDPQNPENTIKELIREVHTEIRQKINENYDNTQQYIPRSKRPEWSAVGLLGKLVVIDDGSCVINGYCKVGEGGIAVMSEQKTRFRVMARLDDNHIKILML